MQYSIRGTPHYLKHAHSSQDTYRQQLPKTLPAGALEMMVRGQYSELSLFPVALAVKITYNNTKIYPCGPGL